MILGKMPYLIESAARWRPSVGEETAGLRLTSNKNGPVSMLRLKLKSWPLSIEC